MPPEVSRAQAGSPKHVLRTNRAHFPNLGIKATRLLGHNTQRKARECSSRGTPTGPITPSQQEAYKAYPSVVGPGVLGVAWRMMNQPPGRGTLESRGIKTTVAMDSRWGRRDDSRGTTRRRNCRGTWILSNKVEATYQALWLSRRYVGDGGCAGCRACQGV